MRYSNHGCCIYTLLQNKRWRWCEAGRPPPPPPPIIFEGRSLPQQTMYHWKGNLIITRETLRPTRWTESHKQATRRPSDAPSNRLASPYQIVFIASFIVQTMDWRDLYGNRQLKPDFIYFKLPIASP